MKEFTTLSAFKVYAKKQGLRVRKVTTTKTYIRHIALAEGRGIVGFFHVKPDSNKGFGHINLGK